MRRWQLLNNLLRLREPRPWDRCVLAVEELESRENPAPVVDAPDFSPRIAETDSITFNSILGSAFVVDEDGEAGPQYTVELTTTAGGTISVGVGLAEDYALTVSDNNSARVVLTGQIQNIRQFFNDFGFTYSADGFRGETLVGVTVTDDLGGGGSASDSVLVTVGPPSLLVNSSGEQWALTSSGLSFEGLLTITSWPVADGSETATILFTLDADRANEFQLLGAGVTAAGPGAWTVTATSQAQLQSIFDSLTLVPPPDFTGRAALEISGSIDPTQPPPSEEPSSFFAESQDLGFNYIDLRFFRGVGVDLPDELSPAQDGTIDLGGTISVSDPDVMPGDSHVLTLSVPIGQLAFDAAAAEAAGVSVSFEGSTITLSGDLGAIQAFLATPGNLSYTPPDPDYVGVVELTVTFANRPGAPSWDYPDGGYFGGEGPSSLIPSFAPLVVETPNPGEAPGKQSETVSLDYLPAVFPSAENVVTNQDVPVPVFITLSTLPANASDVVVIVEGLPIGASFNKGESLGSGAWALSPADLDGLVFNPPPGESGVYTLTVSAVVTIAVPANESTYTVTQSTTFTATVNPLEGEPEPEADPGSNPSTPDPGTSPAPTPSVPPPTGLPDPGVLVTAALPPAASNSTAAITATDSSAAGNTATAVGDSVGGTGSRTENSADRPTVLADAITGSTPGNPTLSPTESRSAMFAPAPGSLFAQPEVPLPTYGGGEKHPLPPVLPLDQTTAVAGFTESGGDSFALIDQLYRDAAAARFDAAAPAAAVADVPGENAFSLVRVTTGPVAAAADDSDSDPAGALVAVGGPSDGEWRFWVAGATVAFALAAWAWLSSAPNGRLARALRRVLHPAHRPARTETC